MSMTHTTAAIEFVGRPSRIKTRLGLILGAHVVIDVYSAYVPPLLGMLEVRCHLSPAQTAMILGLGSVSSGLSQPLSAWLSDRTDSRMFGGLGLLLAAICLSCIGMASSMASLAAIYVLGMVGVGIFHPIGASSIGQLSDALPRARRSLGISLFFVAGMAGGISGSILAPRLAAQPGGFELLRYTMIPGLFVAGALHLAIARISHHEHHRVAAVLSAADIARRWKLVALLYLSNAMRFTVNMTLLYLFVRWAQAKVIESRSEMTEQQVAGAASLINGNLVALSLVGMAVGGLAAGSLIRPGREKWPLVLTPILMAPAVAAFGVASTTGGALLAVLAGVGYAAMIPVTISLSQRILPHRTSLASGLMLGGAWSVALLGPIGAEFCLHSVGLGLGPTFLLAAGLLLLSGVVCLALPRDFGEALK